MINIYAASFLGGLLHLYWYGVKAALTALNNDAVLVRLKKRHENHIHIKIAEHPFYSIVIVYIH